MVLPVNLLYARVVVLKIGGMDVILFDAREMFLPPFPLIVNFYLSDDLQSPTLFHYRNPQPEHTLLVLQSIAGDPGTAKGKLDLVKQYEAVRMRCLVEEPRPW